MLRLFLPCCCWTVLVWAACPPLFSQNSWQKKLTAPGFSPIVAAAPDGGMAMLQTDSSFKKVMVRRFAADGSAMWGRSFQLKRQPTFLYGTGLQCLPDGKVAIYFGAGSGGSNGQNEINNVAFFSPDGGLASVAPVFENTTGDVGDNLFSTKNGLFADVGIERVDQIGPNSSLVDNRPALAKLDEQGNLVWSKVYDLFGASAYLVGTNLATADGGFIFCDPFDLWPTTSGGHALKVDANGQPVWAFVSELWGFSEMAELADGSLLLAAYAGSQGHLLAKFDKDFNPIWAKTAPNGQLFPFTRHLLPVADGGFFLVLTNSQDGPDLVRLDADGNTIWARRLGTCARLDVNFSDINTSGEIVGARWHAPFATNRAIFRATADGHIAGCFEKEMEWSLVPASLPVFEKLTWAVSDLPKPGPAELLIVDTLVVEVEDFCPPSELPVAHFTAVDSACFEEKTRPVYDGNGLANADQTGFNWFFQHAAAPFSREKTPDSLALAANGAAVLTLVQTLGSCRDTFEKAVKIRSPRLDIGPARLAACGDSAVTVRPDSLFLFQKTTWDDGSSGPERTIFSTQKIWLTAEAGGCTAADTMLVEFVVPPDFLPGDTTACADGGLFFEISIPSGGQLFWNGSLASGPKLAAADGPNTLRLLTAEGCVFEENCSVRLENCASGIYAPNVFTPDGDGLNDEWRLFTDPQVVVEIASLKIFDRWGELVFQKENFRPDDAAASWDGLFRGKKLGTAVFAWVAEARLLDGRTVRLRGDVALVR